MLHELRVRDLGIVADLTLLFGPGMTAITGETGAGKTLLVEALELLVGGRADSGLVRDGATEARIEGRFDDPDTGEDLVLARVVPVDGRSRAYVNGHLATVSELSEVGARLVDLHGQHSHQSLLAPVVQRSALDRFAGDAVIGPLSTYRTARSESRRATQELAGLGGDTRARAREIDLVRFQIGEIEDAGLVDADEDAALDVEEALLADATAHREALAAAYDSVENGALDPLGVALTALADRSPFADLAERLRVLEAEVSEVGRDLRLAEEQVTIDPARLEEIRARRHLLRELRRKYGDTLAEVIEFGAEARRRLAELEGYEERAAELEAEIAAADAAAGAAARELSQARRAAAGPLGKAITPHLRELAMPAATFVAEVEDGEAGEDGADRVTFLLAANPGEPARPLARAASGGELSRAMLAARVVLSDAPPTLVFDEVDAGIGGEAGTAVGRLMAQLAQSTGTGDPVSGSDSTLNRQVFCVTHLAQVAAFADCQVVVEKSEGAGRTVASATPVNGDDRVRELSRMLAGLGESTHARRHAAELLATAADAVAGTAR
jgi:DNA repair protein RecN (Recombination protein N)